MITRCLQTKRPKLAHFTENCLKTTHFRITSFHTSLQTIKQTASMFIYFQNQYQIPNIVLKLPIVIRQIRTIYLSNNFGSGVLNQIFTFHMNFRTIYNIPDFLTAHPFCLCDDLPMLGHSSYEVLCFTLRCHKTSLLQYNQFHYSEY